MDEAPQKLIAPAPEGNRDIVATGLGWFTPFLDTWKEVEIAKRRSKDYYRLARDNSRDSVGTTDPRPNVTPDDPRDWFGVDITAPNLNASTGGAAASGGFNGWGLIALLLGALGLGFMVAGAKGK